MAHSSIRVGIIGAAGLSGLELLFWLKAHPKVHIQTITSTKYEGMSLCDAFPEFQDLPLHFQKNDVEVRDCDVVFLAVPNKASLDQVPGFLKQGIRVIDLSGVYRLRDIDVFRKYYQLDHTSPYLLKEAVFGLPEYYADKIRTAQLIANPGCYPTGALLGLLPFGDFLSQLSHPPIIDAKSGVSGAGGRVENEITNYVDVNENFKAYKVFGHQHQPEIAQYLRDLTPCSPASSEVVFTPYLLPVNRGILTTLYLRFSHPLSPQSVRERFEVMATQHPFFALLPPDRLPDLKMVQKTNRCYVNVLSDETHQTWIVITAIDNLVKGASGQAIQNMNLMFGFPETMGLR